ncbi:MAG: hypothetical protein A2X61_12870 [Ignavibacteria bacterium GWB2_35_12]|nr:MAG: hypothetical protein A2X63_03765 [Ignavibacteria bacterium GWA2_35_8]OGU41516.1 MAG: hypothetical protein A2X61_12870 [Ignavibacteria bacterium GWB2_35_12]OGU93003.1 MAG: hypothetical protein A2220_15795 [Ignavibacteria bacterium RIFOXYA2_FULL_35_10]OGV22990.1 MAG: hypothetical protein A2475_10340 [Ignavibacteria bacterium RIFOXYC2_FULL_35_21]
MIRLLTIGFTKKTAQQFFELLKKNGVNKLIDIRINNTSQLSGFAKGKDLEYFVKEIINIPYIHIKDFAPTKELLSDYQNKKIDWAGYQLIFRQLIEQRNIEKKYEIKEFDDACFLCSEESPDKCHRRLLVEFFKEKNPDINIVHLR